jgi:hypothetical protein
MLYFLQNVSQVVGLCTDTKDDQASKPLMYRATWVDKEKKASIS